MELGLSVRFELFELFPEFGELRLQVRDRLLEGGNFLLELIDPLILGLNGHGIGHRSQANERDRPNQL